MKKIPLEKIKTFIIEKRTILIVISVAILLLGIIGGSYMALNPKDNDGATAEGEQALEKLNIHFDTNMINELGQEQAPSVVNGEGGRNPFMSY